MAKGISVYPGEETFSEIKNYIQLADRLGYRRVMTSLHLPETNINLILDDFKKLGKLCRRLKMELMVDVSTKTFSCFSYDEFIKYMTDSSVGSVRIDFGISNKKIVKLSNCCKNFKIVINAGTVLPENFNRLVKAGLNLNNIEVCHNFYPRPETGISKDFLENQTEFYKKNNLKISAFIPSATGKRGPIFEGLPTLEMHRSMKSSLAFRHLRLLGIDNIYFGDNKVTEKELEATASLKDDATALECEIITKNPTAKKILNQVHTDRPDSAESVIRSQESRLLLATGTYCSKLIKPEKAEERKTGDITVDNSLYKRYAGELQICRKNLKKDKKVNIIGRINKDNHFLLPYITKAGKYYFVDKIPF
ncbi:MAG: MupG family TIM beta-alpha barrel fold protein [Victivallales bacterium]|nr:MupG family TIM beta-alpha barrel fold protein [Victivallales bacterium]